MTLVWQTVHVRVNDAATNQPTPVRIRLTNEAGEYFPPLGRLATFATGRNQDVGGNLLLGVKPWAYIDGTCEVRLPAGKVLIEIWKGPEYLPQRLETILAPGKLALRFSIDRWTNRRVEGWYSGDTRSHFLSPPAALLEAAAEDLAVVNVLAEASQVPGPFGKTCPAIPNILAFSGQRPAVEQPGHLVVVNTHNSHPVLGSLGLLNCHRVVYPLTFGGPDGQDDWSLADWCGQCHRKGGLVVWTKVWHQARDFSYGEPLADLLLGMVDALEIESFEGSPFDVLPDWYALLNLGVRVPLVGGSGKDSNVVPLGAMRTYARLQEGEALSYRAWVEAVRAGRTFVTNGPLLEFRVDDREAGSVLRSGTGVVRVRASARSVVPFDRLQVVANGEVVAESLATGSPLSASIEDDVRVPSGGWVGARCGGEHQLLQAPAPQRVFAHTSPVYVECAGAGPPVDAKAAARLDRELERMTGWVQQEARCSTEPQRVHLAEIFTSAREELTRRQAR